MDANEIDKRYQLITDMIKSAGPGPCTLCRRRTVNVGAFFPYDSQKYGAQPGKTRVLIYRLCDSCHDLPDWSERVDDVILKDLAVGQN